MIEHRVKFFIQPYHIKLSYFCYPQIFVHSKIKIFFQFHQKQVVHGLKIRQNYIPLEVRLTPCLGMKGCL